MVFQQSTLDRAKEILREARADLGADLGGFSAVDLLLDNLPELNNSEQARALLAMADDQTFSRG